MKNLLFVTRKLPDAVEARLARDYDATLNPDDTQRDADAIVAGAAGCDGLVVTPTDKITADVINALDDSVRIIATFSVGFEHIDLEAAKVRGITVTHTPGVLTDATADIAMLLMLGAARRAWEGQSLLRSRSWSGWTPTQLMGVQVTGKRLGILGMGRIGQAMADRARGFGMDIHYHKRTRLDGATEQGATYHGDAEDLLEHCDFLALHCPLTPDTHHFLNEARINRLPEGAIVINTARGPVVDDAALIAALKSGRVAAAGLDVFEGEPAINNGYYDLPNAYLLPHLGSATVETRTAMGNLVADNLDAFFAGTTPPNKLV